MKRLLSESRIARAVFIAVIWIVACKFTRAHAVESEASFTVVCSTTQITDFARQVVGDRWIVKSILAPGQDPHLYELKPNDERTVAGADLLLENGLHLEGNNWMSTLAASVNVPLARCTDGVKLLEIDVDGERTKVNDPHAWFDPSNAAVYTRNIANAVSQIDPQHRSEYEARAMLYLNQLRTLHAWIVQQVNGIPPTKRVLVTSHDAFNYFCRAYGLRAAAPAGWSTGQELGGGITPARRRQTIDSIQNFGVGAIFVETSVNPKLIREIAEEAGVQVGGELYSDSMGVEGSAGETYIGMMRENVIKIVSALKEG